MTEAVLVYIGTGIVSAPKDADSHTIHCYPQELLADANGNITDTTDLSGLSASSLITAEFRFTDAYLDTSPMVVEGDVVTLLEHSDSGVVYWEPHARSLIRTITKIAKSYPAKEKENTDDADDNNYKLNLDTEKGMLEFITTRNRKEVVAYAISLNTAKGIFSFTVDNGDIWEWNNADRKLTIVTETIDITAKDFHLTAETLIDGNVTINGNLKVSGTTKIGKSTSIGGNTSVAGGVRANGSVRGAAGRFPNLD